MKKILVLVLLLAANAVLWAQNVGPGGGGNTVAAGTGIAATTNVNQVTVSLGTNLDVTLTNSIALGTFQFGTALEQSYFPAGTYTTWLPSKSGDYGWAIYGDYRNGSSGERYVSGFSPGDPGFHSTGGILLNGDNAVQYLPAASGMLAIGMDVTTGIVIYGGAAGSTNNPVFQVFGDTSGGSDVPTNSTFPQGKTNLVIDCNGDVTARWGTFSPSNVVASGTASFSGGIANLSLGDSLRNSFNHAHATPTLTIASGASCAVSFNSTIGVQYASDCAIIGVVTNGPNAGTNTSGFNFFSGAFGTNYSTPPSVTLAIYAGIGNSGGYLASSEALSAVSTVCSSTVSGWTVQATQFPNTVVMVAGHTYGFQLTITPTSP